MSIVDKVKQLLGQHSDKAKRGIGMAGDMADKKTGGKYADKIDTAQRKATEYTDKLGDRPADRPGDRPDDRPR
ncbi:MAG: antitoxin [Actinomadura sp.]